MVYIFLYPTEINKGGAFEKLFGSTDLPVGPPWCELKPLGHSRQPANSQGISLFNI